MVLDTSFDFRTDAAGKDPDAHSPTLRRYHKQLWSRALPSGRFFGLDDSCSDAYLHHQSDMGEFWLSSDSVIPTYTTWASMKHITSALAEVDQDSFRTISYTIGGMILFPSQRIDGKRTINGARGFSKKIADRFDLTLECIRRHYIGLSSPLGDTLARYRDFFALFETFKGYVDFFMLQDLVADDGGAVRFFMPFDEFVTSPTPRNINEYEEYRRRSIAFVTARNHRISTAVRLASSVTL